MSNAGSDVPIQFANDFQIPGFDIINYFLLIRVDIESEAGCLPLCQVSAKLTIAAVLHLQADLQVLEVDMMLLCHCTCLGNDEQNYMPARLRLALCYYFAF